VSPTPTSCEQSARTDETRWFVDEVHTHDIALKRYLRSSFPALRDVEDIAQESYLRIWKQRAADPIRSAKGFLFNIAHRLALDRLRRIRHSPIDPVANVDQLPVLDHAPSPYETLGRREKVQLLIDAIDALPARCRDVVILRKLQLLSQRETAARLGISEKGVEIQLARGLERCRARIRARIAT
jgi:RNA polymerase sigma factor (sigma-70 family)